MVPILKTDEPLDSLTIGITQGAVTLVLPPLATVSFDLAGRPIGLYEHGFYLARGHDGAYTEKKWLPTGMETERRHLRPLSGAESRAAARHVCDLLRRALAAAIPLAETGRLRIDWRGRTRPPSAWKAVKVLDTLLTYNLRSLADDEARFRRVYGPIGILPPDQYLALVVQVAEGCAWNRCTFCDFYRGTPARVKTRDELLEHIDEIRRYFGSGLSRRCSVFLGDANAFQAEPDHLLWAARTLARAFPRQAVPQPDGIGGLYAFGETLRLLQWPPRDLARLREAGLRRVTIGLETGDDDLRRRLNKPGTADDAAEAVRRLKRAGVPVGLVVLLGAGGREGAEGHVGKTAALLDRLPLDPRDIVYFSVLRETPGGAHEARRRERGGALLTDADAAAQLERLRATVVRRVARERPRTALYDVREFLY